MKKSKVVIIGSGPAGWTAAIYASRAGLNPVLFTGLKEGGQLMDTTEVENYPGFRDGITGPILMQELKEQALRFGTEIHTSTIVEVQLERKPFHIKDENGLEIQADSVIISTGAEAKWLGLPSEKQFWGNGVSACATCDGFFYKNLEVIVVGGGDTACEEAVYLSNICKKVTVLVRSDKMRASTIMQERLKKDNIQVIYNISIKEIIGNEFGVISVDTTDGRNILCSGVFIAIGHSPNTNLFKEQIHLDSDGYIITKPGTTKTNIKGVFACGDVQDKTYRQAITAAGTGCMAALDCEKYLSEIEN
jgi:thioredoxin reductase (NADPH)